MATVVKDPAPRLISPIFFILAGLCFLLPFAGVSCNTSSAGAELGSLSSISQQLGGGAVSPDSQSLTGCLDSLNNYTVATYSGLDLAAGSAPSAAGGTPSGCSALGKEAGSTGASGAAAGQIAIGVQPLLLVAIAVMLLGLLLSLTRFVLRGVVVAATAVAAIILLLVEQGQVSSEVLDKISRSAFGSVSGSLPSSGALGGDVSSYLSTQVTSFFRVSAGIGLILAIVALGVAALYNLAVQAAALVSRSARAGPEPAYETDVGVPPEG